METASSETQGQSVGSGEKAGRNVLENFRPALSPDPTDRPWVSEDVETGTKNCCVIEATHVF